MFRDELQTPLERAVFWTEYVLRHKNGVDHLRLGSRHLKAFEKALIDVYLVIFATFAIICILLLIAFAVTWKLLGRLLPSADASKMKLE